MDMEVFVVDAIARNINEALLFTTREVIPRQRKKKKAWVTNNIRDVCHQRRF